MSNTVSSIRTDLGLGPETNLGSRTKIMILQEPLDNLHTHQSVLHAKWRCMVDAAFVQAVCSVLSYAL